MPVTVMTYYLINRLNLMAGKIVFILASLLFYAYADRTTLIVLEISLLANFSFAKLNRFVNTEDEFQQAVIGMCSR